MKGNTKSCITSHRCSSGARAATDCEICNRCSPDPTFIEGSFSSSIHIAQSLVGESLGRELIIIKPNAVNVVMAAVAAVVARLDHHTSLPLTHSQTAALRHGDKFGLLPAIHINKMVLRQKPRKYSALAPMLRHHHSDTLQDTAVLEESDVTHN